MILALVGQENVARLGVGEVRYEVEKTERSGDQTGSARRHQRRYEQSIVARTDAVVEPLAVMVEVCYALVARTAVLRLRRSSAQHQQRFITQTLHVKFIPKSRQSFIHLPCRVCDVM